MPHTTAYDPNARYWVVYQYTSSECPHIYTTDSLDAYLKLLSSLPAKIIIKSN